MLWISGELKGKSEIRSKSWAVSLQSERKNLTEGSTWTSMLGQINSSFPAVLKVQLSKALPTAEPSRLLLDLGNVTWRISLGLQHGYGCWLLRLQLAGVFNSKVQEREARKHPREPQKGCQNETSKELRACCSINSVTCQVQLWSVWSLQIKEQGSACHTLTVSKLKKREPALYKMNFYFPRLGKVFQLALLLARGRMRCGWAHSACWTHRTSTDKVQLIHQ